MSKKRISLTLEEETVERIDSEADREELNRSQKIQRVLENYFESKGLKNAVILCGDPELKSLDLYNGHTVLSHIIENLAEQGIRRAILLTGQNKQRIQKEFGNEYEGVNIDYFEEESPHGTAAALDNVRAELGDEDFVVLNGHVITDVDLDEMLRTHREQETIATMALTTVENPSNYGVARLKGQKILGFEEKPDPGKAPSRLINAGTYIFQPEIFQHLDNNSLEQVFEKLVDEEHLSGYIYGGKLTDVDDR